MVNDIIEVGTDICSDWSFKDGDLVLVKQNENLCQAINNRLNTEYGSFDLYYDEYGSFLSRFLGWRKSNETLKFIEMEIRNVLNQDVRFQDSEINLEYVDDTVQGELIIYFDDETDLSLSLVLSNLGVTIEETDEEVSEDGD